MQSAGPDARARSNASAHVAASYPTRSAGCRRGGAPAEHDVAKVMARLRAREQEIVQAIFVGVREAVPTSGDERDGEYVAGLRDAVVAAVDHGLEAIEGSGRGRLATPVSVASQARRAARAGVGLEAVLRRYVIGHALLWDFVMQEAERLELAGGAGGVRAMLRAQASVLDDLLVAVACEHVRECERVGRSREHRLVDRVRALLAGERAKDIDLGYPLDGEHLGVLARGAGAHAALRRLAVDLDRRLLWVESTDHTPWAWAWLGGRRGLNPQDVQRTLATQGPAAERELSLAIGESASGLTGWRLTHQQAQAARAVAQLSPGPVTRYADVALLATALKDEMLAGALLDTYIAALQDARNTGPVLCETLRAYLAAECNLSSAAAALGVARRTVENRLRTIEARLGRSVHPCPAELEVALLLDDLGTPALPEISRVGH
jgi:PucR C-terminal helix-turn-helix domain/GGDEF-like domain